MVCDHIGRNAGRLKHIVQAGCRLQMLAHQVEAIRGRSRAWSALRLPRLHTAWAVRPRNSTSIALVANMRTLIARGDGRGVPIGAGVQVVEKTVARHKDLGAFRLLGGASIGAHRSGDARLSRPFDGNSRACQPRPASLAAAVAAGDAVRRRASSHGTDALPRPGARRTPPKNR